MPRRPPLERRHWTTAAVLALLLSGFGLVNLLGASSSEGVQSLVPLIALLFAVAGNTGLVLGMVLARFTTGSSPTRLAIIGASPIMGILAFIGSIRLLG